MADASNPQSWNQYAYVLNNPVTLIDPTGLLYCQPPNNEGEANCIPDSEWNKLSADAQANYTHYDSSDDGKSGGGDANSNAFADLIALQRAGQNARRQAWIRQAQQVPTSQDYMLAIHNAFEKLPDICSIGVQGRVGAGSVIAGFDLNSQNGLNEVSRIQTNIGPVTLAGSASTSGKFGLSGNLRIPGTPISVGTGTPDGRRISDLNVGVRVKTLFSIVGHASLGQTYHCQ